MMSQQSVLSYFKSVKRSNPDQHAAKKRKVILQSHEIESLLETEHDHTRSGDESDAEEDNQSPKVRALENKAMSVQMPLMMIQIGRTSLTPLWTMWRRRVKTVCNLLRWQCV